MSEKGQVRKSMFSVQNMEELGRLYESDTPVLAYDFKRRMVEGWTPEHSHHRGQLVALTQGLLIVETGNERWMFPSQRCAWTPPNCKHAARSVGGAAGSMVDLSPEMCRGLPKTPCVFNTSELLFAIVHRMVGWDLRQPLDAAKKHLIATVPTENLVWPITAPAGPHVTCYTASLHLVDFKCASSFGEAHPVGELPSPTLQLARLC